MTIRQSAAGWAAEICRRAAALVGGDRAATHGDKLTNHANIARLWSAYLWNIDHRFPGLSALDAANMMEALKIARRQAGGHNPDDYIDGAGYAACAGEIAERLRGEAALQAAAAAARRADASGIATTGGVPPTGPHFFHGDRGSD